MKIVLVHTDLRLYWPARLRNLSNQLKQKGHTFYAVEISEKGSPYSFSENNSSFDINWICLFPDTKIEDINPRAGKQAIIEKLNEINPDVVLSGAFAFTSGAAAIDWAKANDKAVIIFDDTKKEQVKRNFLTNYIKRIFYSYIDAIFCPTEDWLSTYNYWGIPKQAIFYGVDVVDNSFWEKRNDEDISVELPNKFLLCVGRQLECKNFSSVIKAYKIHCSKYSAFEFDLVLVGEGIVREQLEQLVDDTIAGRVHFLQFQTSESLREIYHRASFFILPSIQETWGLVVNEAMASCLPIIASKQCGCTNTLVKDCKNGFTFDATNINELVAIFDKISKMKIDEIDSMGKESVRIISNWNLDRFSKGAFEAIQYAYLNKRKPFYFVGKFLLKRWMGRYNPL